MTDALLEEKRNDRCFARRETKWQILCKQRNEMTDALLVEKRNDRCFDKKKRNGRYFASRETK